MEEDGAAEVILHRVDSFRTKPHLGELRLRTREFCKSKKKLLDKSSKRCYTPNYDFGDETEKEGGGPL